MSRFIQNFIVQWSRAREKDNWEMDVFGLDNLHQHPILLRQLLDKLGREFPTECWSFLNAGVFIARVSAAQKVSEAESNESRSPLEDGDEVTIVKYSPHAGNSSFIGKQGKVKFHSKEQGLALVTFPDVDEAYFYLNQLEKISTYEAKSAAEKDAKEVFGEKDD
jgi:hypothetical protein